MRKLIEILSNIGTTKEQSPSERRLIHIVNQASVAAILFCIVFLIANYYSGAYDAIAPSIFSIVLFAIVPFFNQSKQHSAAKSLFVGIALVLTTISVAVSELNTNMYHYFVIVFAAMLVFFPKKSSLKIILTVNLSCMGVSILVSYLGLLPKISLLNPLVLGVVNILILLSVVYILVSTLMKENYLFEKRTIQLLKNINERNFELSDEKTKFETTTEVLIETNAHLHEEVIQREMVEKSLRESNRTLQQFTYVASHDMKEPLRTIGSFSKLLERRVVDKLDEREREYLDFITNGVNRMSVLVDDLLEYAPLSNPVTFEKVDLNNTLELIKHSLINLLERKNGVIEIAQLPSLSANKSQLSQLFQNLISNGLKFNNKENPQIRIICQEQETDYLFSVADNGIGIPKAYQEKIWDLFQRLNNREEFEGSGIGLAIAQKVVTNHQGRIWVESKENEGTTFYFTISKNLSTPSKEVSKLTDLVVKETAHN